MNKVLKILIGVALVITILLIVGIWYRERQQEASKQYQQTIEHLQDSISGLQGKIDTYRDSIRLIEVGRESIREQIKVVFKAHEKVDSDIAVGDWEYNLRFLTDFLSSEDSVPE